MAKTSRPSSDKSATIHDQKLERGERRRTPSDFARRHPGSDATAQGGPVSDDQNSLKIGARGPTALEDFHFREKIFHFDHERIPERVVHARGYGAHGFFETYKSLAQAIRAPISFSAPAKGRQPSSVFPPLQARRARSISPATCVALPSSFIRGREIGTSSVTTSRCSSFRTPSSFPTRYPRGETGTPRPGLPPSPVGAR